MKQLTYQVKTQWKALLDQIKQKNVFQECRARLRIIQSDIYQETTSEYGKTSKNYDLCLRNNQRFNDV